MKMVNFTIFKQKNNKPLLTQGIRIDYIDGKVEKLRTEEQVMVRITFDGIINGMVGEIDPKAFKRFKDGKIHKTDLKYVEKFNEAYRIMIIYKDIITAKDGEV